MRLSSLALSLLLLGASPSFAAGAELGEQAERARYVHTRLHGESSLSGQDQYDLLEMFLRLSEEKQRGILEKLHAYQAIQDAQSSDETVVKESSYKIEENQYTKKVRELLGQETFKVAIQDADPDFFDALSDVVETEPELCARIKHIQISLNPEQDYTTSHYELPTVLNFFIDQTNLETLSLSNFEQDALVSCLSSIGSKKSLKKVAFCNNSLDVEGFRWVVESLPHVVLENADFSRNKIDDIERLTFLLPKVDKIKYLTILTQLDGRDSLSEPVKIKTLGLNVKDILEKSSKYGSSLLEIL